METPKRRLESIDQFRGFAVVTMALANFTSGVHTIPTWLKHPPDIGLTPPDLVAPFFIFAIGPTYGLSARRRASREGWGKTTEHFLRRFAAILGIGSLMVAVGIAFLNDPTITNWGVLQSIGVAGLMTLLADLFRAEARGRRVFLWVSLATLALGVGLAFLTPVSKHRVSSSYVIITLGASAGTQTEKAHPLPGWSSQGPRRVNSGYCISEKITYNISKRTELSPT